MAGHRPAPAHALIVSPVRSGLARRQTEQMPSGVDEYPELVPAGLLLGHARAETTEPPLHFVQALVDGELQMMATRGGRVGPAVRLRIDHLLEVEPNISAVQHQHGEVALVGDAPPPTEETLVEEGQPFRVRTVKRHSEQGHGHTESLRPVRCLASAARRRQAHCGNRPSPRPGQQFIRRWALCAPSRLSGVTRPRSPLNQREFPRGLF